MKNILFTILFLLIANPAFAAARFWVGGAGTWDNSATTHWSTSTGGTGGASVPGSSDDVTFDAASGGGTVTLNYSPSVNSITMGAFTGTLNDGGNNPTVGFMSLTGTGVRALTMTGSWTVTASSMTAWDATVLTNLTTTATASTITLSGSSVTFTANKSWGTVKFTGSGANALGGAATFTNLVITPPSISSFKSSGATVTGNITLTGADAAANRLLFTSGNTTGRIFTVGGTNTITNTDICNITAAGAGSTWSGTSLGNCGAITNITASSPVTRFWVGNSGNYSDVTHWSTSSGGTGGASMPLGQDMANFDSNSFSTTGQTITLDVAQISGLNFTGATNTPALGISTIAVDIHGNVTLIPSMTISGNLDVTFQPLSTSTLISAGNVFPNQVLVSPFDVTATFLLGDNFNSSNASAFLLSAGTLDAQNNNVTCTDFQSTGAVVRTLNMGSGTWTINRNSASSVTLWNVANTNMTLNASTSTIKWLATNVTGLKIFAGAGFTYGTLWIAGTGATTSITGSNTFSALKIDAGRTVQFTNGTTQTITTPAGWQVLGSSGNLITLQSTTGGSAWTLSVPNGFVSSNWLSLQDSTAIGGAKFYAGANSTNVSGNSGWLFVNYPGGNEIFQGSNILRGSVLLQ